MEKKVVLITGASGGIGKEIAKMFCETGATVIISGTKTKVLNALANKLDNNVKIIDSSLDKINDFEEKLNSLNLSVDILVNNAGVTKDGLLIRMKDEDIDSVLNLNLSSMIKLSRIVLKNMMKKRFGRIISISSVVGFSGNAGQVNYSASKSGIIGFTKSLALEVASRGITVNAVAPGYISTPMTENLQEIQKLNVLSKIPIGRFGEPIDVAHAVKFLASEKSSYITGSSFNVDGGWLNS